MSHGVCRGHKDEVVRVAWHPTMRILASGSADGAVVVWKVAQPGVEGAASAYDPDEASVARVDELGPHPGEVYGCAFVGDGGGGPVLATAAGTDLRLWDLESAVEVARVPPVRSEQSSARSLESSGGSSLGAEKPDRWEPGYLFSLASDGGARGLLASACSDGTVKLWGCDSSGRTATAIASVPNHLKALPTATAFLPGGDLYASSGSDRSVVVCDVRMNHAPVRKITTPCVIMSLCAVSGGSPSNEGGGYLAMCGMDGAVRAVPGEGAAESASLRQSVDGDTSRASRANARATPLLCVAADRDGARVIAAGNARVRDSGPANQRGGPFGLKPKNAPGESAGGGASRAEAAEIFVWEATSERSS